MTSALKFAGDGRPPSSPFPCLSFPLFFSFFHSSVFLCVRELAVLCEELRECFLCEVCVFCMKEGVSTAFSGGRVVPTVPACYKRERLAPPAPFF